MATPLVILGSDLHRWWGPTYDDSTGVWTDESAAAEHTYNPGGGSTSPAETTTPGGYMAADFDVSVDILWADRLTGITYGSGQYITGVAFKMNGTYTLGDVHTLFRFKDRFVGVNAEFGSHAGKFVVGTARTNSSVFDDSWHTLLAITTPGVSTEVYLDRVLQTDTSDGFSYGSDWTTYEIEIGGQIGRTRQFDGQVASPFLAYTTTSFTTGQRDDLLDWLDEVVNGASGADGDIAGTAAGTSTASGVLKGDGAAAGTATGTSTATGSLVGVGALAGTAAGSASASGAISADGALAGTAAGTSTATAALSATGTLAGTSSGTATASAALVGDGALSGTASGTSTASGSLGVALEGALSGTAAGTSTASGALVGDGALVGSTQGTSTATATLRGRGALAGAAAGLALAAGVLLGIGALGGTAAGAATATGDLRGVGALRGTASGTSTASGDLAAAMAPGAVSGSAAGSSTASGTIKGFGRLAGTAAGTSTASAAFVVDDTAVGLIRWTFRPATSIRIAQRQATTITTRMTMSLHVGDTNNIDGTFRNADSNALVDPSTVTIVVQSPTQALTSESSTYTYGVDALLTRTSQGLYRAAIPCTESGTWRFAWKSVGLVAPGVEPGLFDVLATV